MKYTQIALLFIAFHVTAGAASLVFPPYAHSYGIRKATPAHLFMFFGPMTKFDDPQGIATAKMVSRDDPESEHDDDEVVVYGVNAGRHELIYNTSMWGLARFGSKGKGRNEFMHPRGVAADAKGNVLVADSGNNRIVQLFNPEKTVHWVRSFSGAEQGGIKFSGPSQIGIDENCIIYVTDSKNNRIVVLDTSGRTLQAYSAPGGVPFESPTTIAVADGKNRASFYKKERVLFCADRNGSRIWKIDFNGTVLKTVVMPNGHRALYGAIDYYHNFYVSDFGNHCIVKFDHDLNLLDIFGSFGKDDNQFNEPRGIAIWKRFGQTFVAEKKGAQYYWVGTECREKRLTMSEHGYPEFFCDLSEYGYVSLFTISESDTLFFLKKRFTVPGGTTHRLSARALNGEPYPTEYTLRVEPTYSSYTYYTWDSKLALQQ